jgi:hypothetical protein
VAFDMRKIKLSMPAKLDMGKARAKAAGAVDQGVGDLLFSHRYAPFARMVLARNHALGGWWVIRGDGQRVPKST